MFKLLGRLYDVLPILITHFILIFVVFCAAAFYCTLHYWCMRSGY